MPEPKETQEAQVAPRATRAPYVAPRVSDLGSIDAVTQVTGGIIGGNDMGGGKDKTSAF